MLIEGTPNIRTLALSLGHLSAADCLRRTCVLLLADQIQISLLMFVNLDGLITKQGKFSAPLRPAEKRP